MVRKSKEAFTWIVAILRKNNVPFQFTGGFAAKLYGSDRPLADFDIDLHDKDIEKLVPQLTPYIVRGPERYIDEQFNIYGVFLNYKGQKIDLCGSDTQKLYNRKKKRWEKENINLSKAVKKKAYSKLIPVIPLKNLLHYKSKISRPVDLVDIKNLGF